MKIKLISPKMSLRPMDSEFKRVMSPSMALLMIAAYTPKDHEVSIEDENAGPLHLDDSPNLVGITVNVDTSKRAYEIAARYRERGIPVIFGGIHVSANPLEALKFGDSVCIGEVEGVWDAILSDAANGNLKTRYYFKTPARLDHKAFPKWELLDSSKYLYTNIVCASRSCPFQCEFCYNSCDYVHHEYRNRPLENVVEEIRRLNTKHIMFIDDNLIGDIHWTRNFLRAIKGMGLMWNGAVSANIVEHPDLLDEMKESGCRSLFIGIESINELSVSSAGKFQNKRNNYDRMVAEIHGRGIMINASLAFGFDHDYPDVFQNTLHWLVENKIETMTAHILTPYPGTKLYKRLEAEGRITDYDWTHYNTAHVVFQPKQMSWEELYKGYLGIYDEFYRLDNIIKRLPANRQQWIPYLFFNFGYRKFGKFTAFLGKLGLMSFLGKTARKLAYGID